MKRNRYDGDLQSKTIRINGVVYKGYLFNYQSKEYFAYKERQINLPHKSINSLWCIRELKTNEMIVEGECSRIAAIQQVIYKNTK